MRIWALLAAMSATNLVFISAQETKYEGRPPEELKSICSAAHAAVIPTGDLPNSADRVRLNGCNPLLLYFGDPRDTKGLTPNYDEARKCAYLAREHDFKWTRFDNFKVIGSPNEGITDEPLETLSLIYAKGDGVALDLDLALRFACEKHEGWEVDDEIQTLDWLKSNPGWSYEGICGLASPTFNPCAGLDLVPKWQGFNRRLQAFMAHSSLRQSQALEVLSQAEKGYFWLDHVDYDNPRDMGGSDHDFEMQEGLLELLEAAQKKPPHYTAEDYRKADADLNRIYRQALKASDEYFTKVGIDTYLPRAERLRDAERAWLKYREAWVGFGSLRWPLVSASNWRTWITQQRTAGLKELLQAFTIAEVHN